MYERGLRLLKWLHLLFELNTIEIKQDISIVKLNISNLNKAVIPRSLIYTLLNQKPFCE